MNNWRKKRKSIYHALTITNNRVVPTKSSQDSSKRCNSWFILKKSMFRKTSPQILEERRRRIIFKLILIFLLFQYLIYLQKYHSYVRLIKIDNIPFFWSTCRCKRQNTSSKLSLKKKMIDWLLINWNLFDEPR